jgi:hypothetical protein
MAPVSPYVTRPLSPDTWDDFARLAEANNGVWGGCWCMGLHPGTSVLKPPQESVFMVLQLAEDYVRPVWPPATRATSGR